MNASDMRSTEIFVYAKSASPHSTRLDSPNQTPPSHTSIAPLQAAQAPKDLLRQRSTTRLHCGSVKSERCRPKLTNDGISFCGLTSDHSKTNKLSFASKTYPLSGYRVAPQDNLILYFTYSSARSRLPSKLMTDCSCIATE